MSDDPIEQGLRLRPPDEPTYRASVVVGSVDGSGPRRVRVRTTGMRLTVPGLAVSAAAVAVLMLAVVFRPADHREDVSALPSRVVESGVLRIGVTSAAPQLIAGGRYQGYDIDVAKEIGRRLRIGVQADPATPQALLADDGARWDALLVALAPGVDGRGSLPGRPYLWRAGAIVTPTAAPVRRLPDLDGRAVCFVRGGEAAAWLGGTLPADAVWDVAPTLVPRVESTFDNCLARLAAGDVTAAVADWSYDVLALPARLSVSPVSPFAVPATPRVFPGSPGARQLLDTLDSILDGMGADGTLAALSKHRFAGLDLTEDP